MKSAIIQARIEPQDKRSAEGVLHRLGISPTEAIRIFYRQITLRQGLPFSVHIPNETTASTLKKSQKGEGIQEFDSLEDLFDTWET